MCVVPVAVAAPMAPVSIEVLMLYSTFKSEAKRS